MQDLYVLKLLRVNDDIWQESAASYVFKTEP